MPLASEVGVPKWQVDGQYATRAGNRHQVPGVVWLPPGQAKRPVRLSPHHFLPQFLAVPQACLKEQSCCCPRDQALGRSPGVGVNIFNWRLLRLWSSGPQLKLPWSGCAPREAAPQGISLCPPVNDFLSVPLLKRPFSFHPCHLSAAI